MSQQFSTTASFIDGSSQIVTANSTWTASDSTLISMGANTGLATYANAGKIWGGDVSITASYRAVTAAAKAHVISADSGSSQSPNPLMPQLNSHWQALGLSPWGSWWGFQEGSGSSFVGSGSAGFTLTPTNLGGSGINYKQTIVNWTRKGVALSGSANPSQWIAASGSGPNLNATSTGFLGYISLVTGVLYAGNGFIGTINASVGPDFCYIGLDANFGSVPFLSTPVNSKTLTGPYGQGVADRVHPYLMILDRTNQVMSAYTDMSVVVSGGMTTWISDDVKGFGTATNLAGTSGSFAWGAMCTGALAELYTNPANAAAFLQALGWNVPWATCPTDSGSIKLPFMPFHWESLGLVPWSATWNFNDLFAPVISYSDWAGKNVNGWNLTAVGTNNYAYNLAAGWTGGWTRNGIMLQSGLNGQNMTPSRWTGGQFDPTGSLAILAYVACESSPFAFATPVIGVGNFNLASNPETLMGSVSPTGLPVLYCAGTSVTGAHNFGDKKVHPVLVVYDHTNSRVKMYTDLESVTGSFNALAPVARVTASIGWGCFSNTVQNGVSGVFVWSAACTGTLAESLSTDGVASNFLKTLGWTVNY